MMIFLCISIAFFTLGMCFAFAQCSVSASTVLHRMLLTKLMKAQMMFFDTKPLGQILNRFSKDMDILGMSVCMSI